MHSAEPGAAEGAERPVGEEAGSQLSLTQADLQQARQENAALRRELMDALALLQQPRNIHTQTTPRPPEGEPPQEQEREEIRRQRAELEAARAELEAARAILTAECQQLEEEKQRKRAAEATATIATQV